MVKPEKVEKAASLEQKLRGSPVSLFTDFRGLTASQMTQLRRQLREADGEYRVVKNTFLRFALEKRGVTDLQPLLDGPTAIVFSQGNERTLSRILFDFIRVTRSPLRVKGGILGDRVVGQEQLSLLSTLPPREELLSRLMGQLNAPITSLVFTLSGLLRGLLGVLQGRIQQLEEGGKE